MRSIFLLSAAAALVGCSTAVSPPGPSAEAEARFQRLVAGKVAGKPQSCLPHFRADNMVVIDDNRVAFDDGSRVYVNDFRGGTCSNLGSGFYTLVTRSGGSGMCAGDFANVVDISSGMTMGSCVLGDFVPYTGPRA